MVGDVDAGKSTILGRMLVDLGQVTPQKLEELQNQSTKRGVPIEYSFLLDAFQLERDQAITLDISRIWLRMPDRDYVFVDAPGHRELIRNLLTGASEVDAAIMVVADDEGITLQTRRQALFLQWFGFKEILVVDQQARPLATNPETAFAQRKRGDPRILWSSSISCRSRSFRSPRATATTSPLPASAAPGGRVRRCSSRSISFVRTRPRPAVRCVSSSKTSIAAAPTGSSPGGSTPAPCVPANASSSGRCKPTPSSLRSIAGQTRSRRQRAGDAIAISLDERIFVDRGAVASYPGDGPALGHALQATVVWLGSDPVMPGAIASPAHRHARVLRYASADRRDDRSRHARRQTRRSVSKGDVGVITLAARELIAADDELETPASGVSC